MTIAKSLIRNGSMDIEFPEDHSKPLDLADKYPPADCYDDDEPTIKIQVPIFKDQIVVEGEKRYPGVGLVIAFSFGLAFWGFVAYLIWG